MTNLHAFFSLVMSTENKINDIKVQKKMLIEIFPHCVAEVFQSALCYILYSLFSVMLRRRDV